MQLMIADKSIPLRFARKDMSLKRGHCEERSDEAILAAFTSMRSFTRSAASRSIFSQVLYM
jgi:hypothetical protein